MTIDQVCDEDDRLINIHRVKRCNRNEEAIRLCKCVFDTFHNNARKQIACIDMTDHQAGNFRSGVHTKEEKTISI